MSAPLAVTAAPGTKRDSVTGFSGVDCVFATALPRNAGNLNDQTRDAVESIRAAIAAQHAAAVNQVVFVEDPAWIPSCRHMMRELYGDQLPATTFIPQPPCEGKGIAIEALGLRTNGPDLKIERHGEHLLVARFQGMDWVFAAGAAPRTSAPGVYEKSACALQQLRRLLPKGGAHFSQIVRAWFYLGSIVAEEGDHQRYHEFNRARTDFYEDVRFLQDRLPEGVADRVFPASTGIGVNGKRICMSAIAVASSRSDVVAVPLENPRQTSAYRYGKSYSPQTPKFSRGMALHCGRDTMLFVSGTASITNSETRHPGNAELQTHETLENIAALISKENLARHGLAGSGTTLDGLAVIRAYVKRPEDYEKVREVCQSRLGAIPATYVVADVCRPDLLVEIEGVAMSHAAGPIASVCRTTSLSFVESDCSGQHGPHCPSTCPELHVCPHASIRPEGESGAAS